MQKPEVQETHPPYPHASIVAVDFDGTLVEWDALDAYHEMPLAGARAALLELKRDGRTIAIFTSRLDPTWLLQSNNDFETQYNYVKNTLRRLDIPFDFITGSKIPSKYYFDDRAITFAGNWDRAMAAYRTGVPIDQLGWAAGIFEGEGWIYQNPKYPNQIEVGVEMTDEDTIQRLNALFPGSVFSRQRDGNKRTYRWRRSSRASVEEFTNAILPWLGQRRSQKVKGALSVTQLTATGAITSVGSARQAVQTAVA